MSIGLEQVYTREGHPYRALVLGQTTRIDVAVEIESSTAVTISSATLEIARDSTTTKTYTSAGATVTLSGNEATVDVSDADIITTLSLQELQTCTGAWTISVTGHPNTLQFEEIFFVSRKKISCPVSTRTLIDSHALLGNINAYPIDSSTGQRQTSWAPQIRIAWRNVMQWFSTMGRDRAPWMICNCMALEPLVRAECVIVIAELMINGANSQIWAIQLERALKERIDLRAASMAEYAAGSRTGFGKAPPMEKRPIQEPIGSFTGVQRGSDFGKY